MKSEAERYLFYRTIVVTPKQRTNVEEVASEERGDIQLGIPPECNEDDRIFGPASVTSMREWN